MVAVPRKAVGMMLGAKRVRGFWGISGGSRICVAAGGGVQGLRGCLLPGVDGDAHLQEGSQIDSWKDRTGCHQSYSGGFIQPLCRIWSPVGCGRAVPVATYL